MIYSMFICTVRFQLKNNLLVVFDVILNKGKKSKSAFWCYFDVLITKLCFLSFLVKIIMKICAFDRNKYKIYPPPHTTLGIGSIINYFNISSERLISYVFRV